MAELTIHVDLLGQLNKLHLSGHVAHGAHAVAQVPAVDVAILVFVKFSEGLSELWGREQRWTWLGVGPAKPLGPKAAIGPTSPESQARELPKTVHSSKPLPHRECPTPYQALPSEARGSLPLFPPTSVPSASWMAE